MYPTRLVRVFSLFLLTLLGAAPIVAAQAVEVTPSADQREQVILPNPTPGSALGFGVSVALDGDTMVVGAPYFAAAGAVPGSASIYVRSGGTWLLQQTLSLPGSLGFGGTVDVSGDTVIVGALNYGSAAAHARVYARNGSAWTLQATLIPTDYAPGPNWTAQSVAIDGDTAVVGTGRAAAYVFARTGTAWTQQAKLTPGIAGITYFDSRSVALDGDTAVIGAPYAAVGANAAQGGAYVFVRNGTTWIQQGALTSAGASRFGTAVALSGDTALSIGGASSRAYRFTRAAGVWTEQAPIVPANVSGFLPPRVVSVALDTDTAILGVRGSAQVFRRVGGQWSYQDRLVSGYVNFDQDEYFGFASAVSGSAAVVGAPDHGRSDETNGPGRAYGYALPSGPPEAPALTGSVSGTTVSLSWTPAAVGAVPTAYTIEVGTTPGSSNLYVGSVGNVLLLSTPAPPATYHVRVRGVNAFGPSAPSNEITLTVGPATAPLPGAPTLTGSVSQSAVSLAWTPAATGGVATSYVLEVGTSPGAANLFNGNVGAGTQLSATAPPAVYYVRVRGVNASGTGPASNEVALTATGCALPATTHRPEFLVGGHDGDAVVECGPGRGGVLHGSRVIPRRAESLRWHGGRGDHARDPGAVRHVLRAHPVGKRLRPQHSDP